MSTAVVFGYTREAVGDPPGTTQQHEAEMRQYAGVRLPGLPYGGTFVDRADTRRVPLRWRSEGFRLGQAAEPGDHVLVARFSRGFSSLGDLMATEQIWSARGVRVHVLDIGLSPLSAEGRAVAVACRALTAAGKALAKEVGAADFLRRRSNGAALNGNAPPCFRYVGPRGKRRLVQDPRVRRVAAGVVEWWHAGWSWEAIYRHLYRCGVRQRNGKEFSMTTLRRLCVAERRLQAREAAQAGGVRN
jgi:DNA invertase Pin-like site-specific DNA recombinase